MKHYTDDLKFKTPTQIYYEEICRECALKHDEQPDYNTVANNLNMSAQQQGFENFDAMYQHNLELHNEKTRLK